MKTRWFVAKCQNFVSLESSLSSGVWGCRERKSVPQPADVLGQAMKDGAVVLLFSVNNRHGWHGAAVMTTEPVIMVSESVAEETPQFGTNSVHVGGSHHESGTAFVKETDCRWYQYEVKWITAFQNEFREQCLPFTETKDLLLWDGTPVNKARNFQELDEQSGKTLQESLAQYYDKLCMKRDKKLMLEAAETPPPFFQPISNNTKDMKKIWPCILEKVKDMGKVLLACAFGSQRYNLHTPESDTDMFIIYAATAKDMLGFNPPKQTIKNRERESCDYTIHEVFRYCELLLGGDARCVETLFLHPSCIYYATEEWRTLCQYRRLFLTKQCLEKYLGDATGSRGLKQLEKWQNRQEANPEKLPSHISKLFYIVIRLLQNARDVSRSEEVVVYRSDHSDERKLLMDIRHGGHTYKYLKEITDRLLNEIESNKLTISLPQNPPSQKLEEWLLELRYSSIQTIALC